MQPALAPLVFLLAPLIAPPLAALPAEQLSAAAEPEAVARAAVQAASTGWQARAEDNICGLRDPRQVSSPAKVDFRRVMDATPEMQRLRRDRVDPNSAEGIQLTEAARSRVAEACELVMADSGHCSVWKTIRHTDGREVPDVTEAVRERL